MRDARLIREAFLNGPYRLCVRVDWNMLCSIQSMRWKCKKSRCKAIDGLARSRCVTDSLQTFEWCLGKLEKCYACALTVYVLYTKKFTPF